ncbi:MAG: hypothetical protein KGJ40_01230 [candidate division NC10 bacterium]|nr:hypothetical protein [candidate division NC10 bacterium]
MNKTRNSVRSVIVSHCLTLSGAIFPVAIGICIALTLAGCGEIGMMASETQSFHGKDSITLQIPRSDILDVIAEVGKSLGYNVSSLDREAGTISLSSGASLFTGVMIGKINNSTLQISSIEGGKKLGINVSLMGNFGTGDQEAATNLVGDFKAKLLQKIGQQ